MLNILFPRFCMACTNTLLKQEKVLCSYCLCLLPLTRFHLQTTTGNSMEDKFYGLLPVYQATSLMYFTKKGIAQKVLHKLKYEGHQQIGTFFGNWLGSELQKSSSYSDIDIVIPVPLDKKRLRKRGYNQVANFAIQIAFHLQAKYCDTSLTKITSAVSQVGLSHWSRWRTEKIFSLKDRKSIKNKHVLLVDDLITTGATLTQCGKELLKAPIKKLSIATLAMS